MKRIVLLFLGCFIFSVVNAQEVSDKQWNILTKKTADWCPFCGGYGWDFFEGSLARFGNTNTIMWAAHHSGGLSNDASKAVANNWSSSGQPVFFFDSENLKVTSSNVNEKLDEVGVYIDALSTQEPTEMVGTDVAIGDNGVTAKTTLRFNTSRTVDNDMNVVSYIVKKQLIAKQSGQGNNAAHKNVILGTVSGDAWGNAIENGDYTAGDEIEFTTDVSLDNWNYGTEDLKIVTVIWSYDDGLGRYYFVNGNEQGIRQVSSTQDEWSSEVLEIIRISHNSIDFRLNQNDGSQAQVILTDMQGKMITKNNIVLDGTMKSIAYNDLSNQLYNLSVISNNKVKSEIIYIGQ